MPLRRVTGGPGGPPDDPAARDARALSVLVNMATEHDKRVLLSRARAAAAPICSREEPGGQYVTWLGIDGYFIAPSSKFNSVFGKALQWIHSLCKLPIMLSETAVGPDTDRVATDIQQLFTAAEHNNLIGVVWFDRAQHGGVHHQDWSLKDDQTPLEAFRQAAHRYQERLAA